MYKLVLLRHGESIWNKANRFTGWTDVDLSDKGIEEAKRAGILLEQSGYEFDLCFTSVLKRAIRTLWLAMDGMDAHWLPVIRSWRLNERHYGALQGLNKTETAEKHGEEQVHIWRRSYATRPPLLSKDDSRYPGNDRRYSSLNESELPLGECLKDTVDRFMPLWHREIAPEIKAGKRILIAAHGNSLRALCKFLDDISDEEITDLNIPTGVPLVYELDIDLRPVKHYYLGDQARVKASIEAVKNQAKG